MYLSVLTAILATSQINLIAHRGVSAEHPENTLTAFHAAVELGCHAFELDVHLTRDQVPVVVHDADYPSNNQNIRIVDMTAAELRIERPDIPTLAEVLAIDRGDTRVMVELKGLDTPPAQLVEEVVKVVTEAPRNGLILGSLSKEVMTELVRHAKEYPVIGIADRIEDLNHHINLGCNHLAISHQLATNEQLIRLKKKGHKVWVFTVDDPILAEQLLKRGADGVITNHPRQIGKG